MLQAPDDARDRLCVQLGLRLDQPDHLHCGSEKVSGKTSQELRMLSNVTLNCQVAKIVMNTGSQLSEL